MLTNEDWAGFYHVLFECVPDDEDSWAEVMVPLTKAMEATGYVEEASKYLEVADAAREEI